MGESTERTFQHAKRKSAGEFAKARCYCCGRDYLTTSGANCSGGISSARRKRNTPPSTAAHFHQTINGNRGLPRPIISRMPSRSISSSQRPTQLSDLRIIRIPRQPIGKPEMGVSPILGAQESCPQFCGPGCRKRGVL